MSRILDTLALGPDTEKMKPFSWFENQWDVVLC